jgi:glycosyltransferase involved in cell wall biosynthesis
MPVISIVTPSYNQGAFLAETMASILNQHYPALEYIVQDGGSTDGSAAVLAQYRSLLTHCESAPDRGQAHAINRGFQRATGAILAYLNSDDLLLPGTLRYVARYFSDHPRVDVVYGHRIIIDAAGGEVGRWILPPHQDEALLWRDYIPQETLFWRRSLWDRVGGMVDENLQFALDWDLLLRFHRAGARFVRLPCFLGAFRVHPQQKTATHLHNVGAREVEQLQARYHGRTVSEPEINRRVRHYLRQHWVYERLYHLGLLGC